MGLVTHICLVVVVFFSLKVKSNLSGGTFLFLNLRNVSSQGSDNLIDCITTLTK